MVLVMLKKKQVGKTWPYVTEKEKLAKEMKKSVFLQSTCACGVLQCVFACVHVCVAVRVCMCICACVCVHACVCVCVYACEHACMWMHV